MNKIKKTIRGAGLLAALALIAGTATAQESQRLVVPLTNPGSPATLHASVMSGSISVTAYEGNEIIVVATLEAEEGEVERKDGMMRIPNSSIALSIEEEDNIVEISGEWSQNQTRIEIQVPANTSLELATVNGGELEIDGVSGTHTLENVNGGIKAVNISGTLIANTTNGDVLVSFRSLEPNTPMSFTSFNGDVDLTLPGSTAARFLLDSGLGEILTDFDLALEPQEAKVTRDESERGYRVRVEKQVVGRINGGDTEFRLKTYNGDIIIRKADN
jgi:DUF4097 and DUF4098 domain-containing protein YvlB